MRSKKELLTILLNFTVKATIFYSLYLGKFKGMQMSPCPETIRHGLIFL